MAAAGFRTTKGLSDYLGVPAETLRYWRRRGRGPRYTRGESDGDKATVLYSDAAVEEWLKSRTVNPAGASIP